MHISVYHIYAWCPRRPKEGLRTHGPGVTDSYDLSCGCWKSNPGPVDEEPVLLTAEPSLLWFPFFGGGDIIVLFGVVFTLQWDNYYLKQSIFSK